MLLALEAMNRAAFEQALKRCADIRSRTGTGGGDCRLTNTLAPLQPHQKLMLGAIDKNGFDRAARPRQENSFLRPGADEFVGRRADGPLHVESA